MSNSLKFAGKNDNGLVTPISVSNDGYLRTERCFASTYDDVVNKVFTAESAEYYSSLNVKDKGLVAVCVFNRSGVDLDIKFNSPMHNSESGSRFECYNTKLEKPIYTIPDGAVMIITPEELPMLNYAWYLNISLTPSDTPTGEQNTVVRVYYKG